MRIPDGWKPVYITLTAVGLIIVVLAPLGYDVVKPMTKDDGIIQLATCAVLCFAAVLALLRVITQAQPMLKWLEAACILSGYAMREMDFHRIFTAENVTRLGFYTGPFPLGEKLIGGTIILFFIVIMVHFLITNAPLLIQGLKKGVPQAWYCIVWAFLLFGAQLIDKPHIFKVPMKFLIEETMELGAAMMVVFIVMSFFRGKAAMPASETLAG